MLRYEHHPFVRLIIPMILQNRYGVVVFSHKVTRIDDVEDDCKNDAGTVDAQSNPPEKLFVKSLLKVFEHNQTDCQTSYSARDVGYKRH